MAETGLVERKTPVFLISLEDGVFTTLYENDYVRHEERAFGRSTFADLDAEMNNPHTLLRHVLLAKLGSLREVGDMATYNAETDQVRVRMTAQLVSAWGGRRAFLIVGSDLVDQVGEGGDPTAKDYWDRLRVLRRDDPITGLASIGALQDELARVAKSGPEAARWDLVCFNIARVAKSGPEAARWDLVCFNIRHFSVYNQRNGFVKGNALLRELGSVISEAAQTDRVARYFSDHFYALVARDRTEQAVDWLLTASTAACSTGAGSAPSCRRGPVRWATTPRRSIGASTGRKWPSMLSVPPSTSTSVVSSPRWRSAWCAPTT